MRNLLCFLGTMMLFGCVDDTRTTQQLQDEERYPELEPADPLDLSTIDVGVGLRHGEAMAMAYIGSTTMADVTAAAPHAVFVVRGFDQASQEFGEFHVFPAPQQVTARGITEFIRENTSNAFLGVRVEDLFAELDDAESQSGESFESRSVVANFWRYKNDWYLRWDGNLEGSENTTGKGPYGFYRDDMVGDLLTQIETAAGQNPRYFIVGEEMQQLIAKDGAEGLAPAEFSNFLAFYKDAIERIKGASASTAVGCGINYDAFLSDIVPLFYLEGDTTNVLLERAFNAVIMPCAELGDVIALRSYRVESDDMITLPTGELSVEDAYQFLRRVPELFGTDKPIVWYSAGSPITSPVNDARQRNYLEAFLGWIGGTSTEFIGWRFAMNLDGSDTGDQQPAGQCLAFTESGRDYQLPKSHCYDGLFSSVFSAKEPLEVLQSAE